MSDIAQQAAVRAAQILRALADGDEPTALRLINDTELAQAQWLSTVLVSLLHGSIVEATGDAAETARVLRAAADEIEHADAPMVGVDVMLDEILRREGLA
ncbi:hypothetical protein ACFQ8T_12560 [Isoptericola sp. NPDC056618]|uniref:hypothetical protein n=1 Tax=Isoptericola sp. NPDC056618 TaxID=3345878 RepID=UPI00367FDE52